MKDLSLAAKAKFGFSLEYLAQHTELNWDEYQENLNGLLHFAKTWKIDLNRQTKSGKNILQCLLEKVSTIKLNTNQYSRFTYNKICFQIEQYISNLTSLGVNTNLMSEQNQQFINKMDTDVKTSVIASYKLGRAKFTRKQPSTKKALRALSKNGWAQSQIMSTEITIGKSASK